MFKKLNPEKKRAYSLIVGVSLFLLFTFQNFDSFETSEKTSTDLSSALNTTENEIEKTKQNINKELKLQPNAQNRQVAHTGQVVLSKEPIRIKLKRAPAKVQTKKKKPKSKLKKKKKPKLPQS